MEERLEVWAYYQSGFYCIFTNFIMEELNKKQEDDVLEQAREKSATAKDTERIIAETEDLNKAIAEKENADARAKMAGVTDAGQPTDKPKEETAVEYKDRVEKGLVA